MMSHQMLELCPHKSIVGCSITKLCRASNTLSKLNMCVSTGGYNEVTLFSVAIGKLYRTVKLSAKNLCLFQVDIILANKLVEIGRTE